MILYPTYLKDIIGNNYIGLKISHDIVSPFLSDLEDILGDQFDIYTNNQKNRDGGSYHITVINVMDYNRLSKEMGVSNFIKTLDAIFKYPIDDLKLIGIGSSSKNENTAYYIVCQSNKLDDIRYRYNLPEYDFHITLGFKWKDVFGVRKNKVIDKKSKFLKLLSQEFLERDNFNFIKNINNYDENKDLDIIPVSINDNFMKIKVGENLLDIGVMDNGQLCVFTRYKDQDNVSRMPTTEFLKYIKKINI